jgi:hypothetical protein
MVMPEYITLIDWADNLLIDYPKENLPVLQNELEWREWAELVVGSGEFLKRDCPAPTNIDKDKGEKVDAYKDWQDWARIVYMIMSTSIGREKIGQGAKKKNVKI